MRKTFSYYFLAILVGGLFYAGCKEKPVTTPGDLEAPKIIMSSPEIVPMSGPYVPVYSTDSFDVDIRFEDDIELRDYEVTIRFRPELSYLRTANDPWSETWHGSLEGTSDAVNFRVFSVYNPTAGPYEFRVKVSDEDGKTTELVTYLEVTNRLDSIAPRIRYISPDTVTVDTVIIGQNLNIRAVVDEVSPNIVKDVYLRVRDVLTNELLANSELRWDTVYQSTVVVDSFITVPAGTVPGNYKLELYGIDPTNNIGMKAVQVYIKPN